MKTKVCPRCKEEKPSDSFCRDRNKKSGLTSHCKSCKNVSNTIWRSKNPDKIAFYNKKSKQGIYVKRKMFCLEYKGNKCEDCGIIANVNNRSIFDFHHTDPSMKDKGIAIGSRTRSIKSIKQELDKCILLCANCHRLRHQHYKDGLRETL
jgi:hypothetical protein